MFEGELVTKAGAAPVAPYPSAEVSTMDTLESEAENLRNGQRDSSQTLQGEEDNLQNVVGRPDGETEVVDDVERQYLGRWEAAERE